MRSRSGVALAATIASRSEHVSSQVPFSSLVVVTTKVARRARAAPRARAPRGAARRDRERVAVEPHRQHRERVGGWRQHDRLRRVRERRLGHGRGTVGAGAHVVRGACLDDVGDALGCDGIRRGRHRRDVERCDGSTRGGGRLDVDRPSCGQPVAVGVTEQRRGRVGFVLRDDVLDAVGIDVGCEQCLDDSWSHSQQAPGSER